MSIPPLVCSTPPPPDQCDDDKDHEDFDLSYRLSHDEDEDDAYDYGSFSTYNNFQTSQNRSCDKKEQNIQKPIECENQKDTEYDNNSQNTKQYVANNDILETNNTQDITLKCEEDINIEDLNLEDIVTKVEVNNEESELKEPEVQNNESATEFGANSESLCNGENASGSLHIAKDTGTNFDKFIDSNNVAGDSLDSENTKTSRASPIEFEEPIEPLKLEEFSKNLDEPSKIYDTPPEQKPIDIDDDFGDFDDFQLASPDNPVANVVTECDNPWEKNEPNQSDFGSFTANFEDNQFHVASPLGAKEVPSNESSDNQTQELDNDLEDDDFGDFDDFKSSTVTAEATETTVDHSSPCQDVPVLNLQSTENEQQIMESINKVLTDIFLEEIKEPESQFEGKLESLLSVTWSNLMKTDERQPYIVNWNNSLGQKTLLKALCIDSRNILFGPKWNTSMPKYAANLSVAPLQPQKPLSPSNPPQSEINTDKTSSKNTTWSDPFTTDGQEFTYAEALLLDLEHLMATLDQMAHNHSTLKISEFLSHACNTENDNPTITTGPTDLDVFEGAVSSKSEKIYSSTLSVQPLRQINLPDTHIFTPTDSETPRSKTIHYDCTPTVLLPQSVMTDSEKQAKSINSHNSEVVGSSNEDDNEYWEFQDFKSTSNAHIVETPVQSLDNNSDATTSANAFTKSNVVFQTQPLQPIKVEPTMPTLNWPEPGEVKGAFDDFSDFVCISSQTTEMKGSSASDTRSQMETSKEDSPEISNDLNDKSEAVSKDILNPTNDDFDDDFNTFQSALPSKPTITETNTISVSNSTSQVSSRKIPDFDYTFPKTNSFKSDTISFPSITRPNEALTQILGHNSNTTEIMNKSLLPSGTQVKANVLQPTPATFNAVNTQHQQILQPLSLESYSQINWPSPGIDLQDLSRFNPVETLQSLKSDISVSGLSKGSSPVHNQKNNAATNQMPDDDVWGEFVSSNPKQQSQPKKPPVFADDDEWTDFISSPSVKPQNGLNTISFNVHTSSNIQKSAMQNKFSMKSNQAPLDIPTLNYITPKSGSAKTFNDRHFQNL